MLKVIKFIKLKVIRNKSKEVINYFILPFSHSHINYAFTFINSAIASPISAGESTTVIPHPLKILFLA